MFSKDYIFARAVTENINHLNLDKNNTETKIKHWQVQSDNNKTAISF